MMAHPVRYKGLVLFVCLVALIIGVFLLGRKHLVPATTPAQNSAKHSVVWQFSEAGIDESGTPRTAVALVWDGVQHDLGAYDGSCKEVGPEGGIDGTGLLENEVSAVQCWFAGGGNELGVFKYGDQYIVNLGMLEEGDAEQAAFRGTFEGLLDL